MHSMGGESTAARRLWWMAAIGGLLALAGCADPAGNPAEPPAEGPAERPIASVQAATVTCADGQSDCGGACQSTGAACTVGVGACANTGTVVCGTGTPDLAARATTACALGAGGTVQCWGGNANGALGDGTLVTRTTPVSVRGLRNATAVAVGIGHACALLADATVRCWGRNSNGQLGDGTTTQRTTPVAVSGLAGVTRIVANGYFTCALLTDGSARCWGLNSSGQLGDGTITQRPTPVPVQGLAGVIHLATGTSHACAVLNDGTAQCWGRNTNGQLGDGTTVQRSLPGAVAGVADATAVVAGTAFTCALRAGGAASCWGLNSSGQLGDGTAVQRLVPVNVNGLAGAAGLAAGAVHACATESDGTARCWGSNVYGQLGDGTLVRRLTPTVVPGLTGVLSLAAGDRITCSLLTGGAVQCWGDNASGQLGDGSNVARPTPAPVVGLDAGTTCSVTAGAPTVEVCDGVDNDCNGAVDDIAATACTAGACASRGHQSCGAGPGFPTICVADVLRATTTVCRAAVAGGCDLAEYCDGVRAECPADVVQGAGTLCRSASGVCDTAELCTGTSNACPADVVQTAGTVCRPAVAGVCDVAETCTGAAKSCPTDRFQPATTVCRAAAGPCDVAETCRGNSSACPVDALRPSTYVCRTAVAGGCDVAETCTGGAVSCPGDAVRLAGTTCRAAISGGCDVAEVCDGVANVCPANVVRPAGAVCRASGGVCDVGEVCDGTAAACPVNAFQPSAVVCRAAVGLCDAVETCTGTSRSCPANVRRPAGAICGAAVGPCDVAEVCTGASTACPTAVVAAAGTVCRGAADACDVAEVCNGAATSCPADLTAAANTACDDGDPCTQSSACSAGACVGSNPLNCDDGNACTADACGVTCVHTAIAGCGSPTVAILPPPNPPVDTASATQEVSNIALIDPAGVVAPGAFGVSGLAVLPGELNRFVSGWAFAPAGTLSAPVVVRVPVNGTPGTLYAVAGRIGGTWQVESVARVTADGTHAVAQLARFGEHALVAMPGCDSTTGAYATGLEVGDPQQWAPQSPIVVSEFGGTWAWLSQGVYIHVGSRDYLVEEGPRSAEEGQIRMSGNGAWLAYVRDGIRRYELGSFLPAIGTLDFTTVAMPEGPEGPWQYKALAMSWNGGRMVFIAEEPTTGRSDAFLWEGFGGIRPITSADGRDGSLAINNSVREIALSANGRWMTFVTNATDVVPSYSEPGGVYLRDLQTGQTTLVAPGGSVRSAGASISRSGRFVAWRAPFVGDEAFRGLWVWDRATNVRAEVNRDADGTLWESEQWSMSNDGTRFVFGGVDYDSVEMRVRTRWLRAGSSTPLYALGVSPDFGDVTGVFPVITGSGGYVFTGEYSLGTASPPVRVVRTYTVPTEAIPGSARAVAGDRWEYEPMRVEWGGFSPFNAHAAFVWEPATGFSAPIPMSGDTGDVEVSPRLPLGRHPVITVQNFDGGDGVGVCFAREDFQVSRARVQALDNTYPSLRSTPRMSGPYRPSSGARYFTPFSAWGQDPDATVYFRRFDRRDGNPLNERIEGLTFPTVSGSRAAVALDSSGRHAHMSVDVTSTDPATLSTYFIDLATRTVTASRIQEYAFQPGFPLTFATARVAGNGRTAVVASASGVTTGFYVQQSPWVPVESLERSFYTERGHNLLGTDLSLVDNGTRIIFQEEINREEEQPGFNPIQFYRYEMRRWNRDLGSETLLLSWPEKRFGGPTRYDSIYAPRVALAQMASNGRWVTFCGDTPEGFPGVPAVEYRGAAGARWLYDIDNHVLRQLSSVCVDDRDNPPVFIRSGTNLVYVDARADATQDLIVLDLVSQTPYLAVGPLTSITDLNVSRGGAHATFRTNDALLLALLGTSGIRDILVPLQSEYLGEVIPEAP